LFVQTVSYKEKKFYNLVTRNCRVKYFKDQASIKACTDSTLIAKHILDQCPAKAKPVNPDPENY
jgi:hypothetical protein